MYDTYSYISCSPDTPLIIRLRTNCCNNLMISDFHTMYNSTPQYAAVTYRKTIVLISKSKDLIQNKIIPIYTVSQKVYPHPPMIIFKIVV